MLIRAVREEDIPACLRIYNHYVLFSEVTFDIEPLDLSQYTEKYRRITARYPWIVLEEEGRLLGYAYLDAYNPKYAYRFTADVTIYLDPEAKGKGYGRQLFRRLIEIAEADRYQTLFSLVTKTNRPSIHMHEAFGFRKLAVLEQAGFKHGAWLSTILYEKRIGNYPTPPEEVLNLDAGEVVL